jgi:hypothetical protein
MPTLDPGNARGERAAENSELKTHDSLYNASMQRIVIAAAFLFFPVALQAQWLDFPTSGIPRTPDGKANMTAPAPRLPDGKPDFSGTWQPAIHPYRFDLIQDLKDETIFRPAAEAIYIERV